MFKTKFNTAGSSFNADFEALKLLRGEDGFSPDIKVYETEEGYQVILTDKDETHTIYLTNGKDGVAPSIEIEPGDNGYYLRIIEKDKTTTIEIKDGYTPVKGVDYFDGKDGVDGYTPIKGKDYFDGADGADGKDGYVPVKGVDYFDGKDGTDGKDGFSIYSVDNFGTSDGNTGVYIEKYRFNIPDSRSLNIGDLVIVTKLQKLYQIIELEGYGSPDLIRTKYLCDIKGNPGDKGDPGEDGLSIYTVPSHTTSITNYKDKVYIENSKINIPEGRTLSLGDLVLTEDQNILYRIYDLGSTDPNNMSNSLCSAQYVCELKGKQGDKGEPGKSAYSYAKDGGYSGTEEEFAEKLAGEVDITNAIPIPTFAAVGQTVVVKTVDENGKPTEWKAVDIPEQVQTDWNQTDEAASDYIKNKPEIATDEDVMELITKLGYVIPVASSDGSIYIEEDGVIYSL